MSSNLVKDRRRLPFFVVTKPAMAKIRSDADAPRPATLIAVYVAIVELANDARSESFEAPRKKLAEYACVNVRAADEYVERLEALELVHVERRHVDGVNLPNIWTLLEPEQPAPEEGGGLGPPLGAPAPNGSRSQTARGSGRSSTPSQEALIQDEEEAPLPPPSSSPEPRPTVGRKRVTDAEQTNCEEIVAAFNEVAKTSYSATGQRNRGMVVGRIREHPELGLDDHRALIAAAFADPWWKDHPGLSVVYGNDAIFERSLSAWRSATVSGSGRHLRAVHSRSPEDLAKLSAGLHR